MKNLSQVLHGIEIAQILNEREEKVWIQLSSTYTQEDLLVDNREMATTENLRKWKRLDKLKPVMSLEAC